MLLSDDDGYSWQSVHLPTLPVLKSLPRIKAYAGLTADRNRPSLNLPIGRLMMLLRTAMDFYYQSFSDDYGQTWTAAEPSPFYGTITSPLLLTLSSRTIAVFRRSYPAPAGARAPADGVSQRQRTAGQSEDVFTNRDVYAALSDDHGRTWQGFREIWLNPLRNAADFAWLAAEPTAMTGAYTRRRRSNCRMAKSWSPAASTRSAG